jgi:hypothetical protein
MVRTKDEQRSYSTQDVRQGDIVLRKRWERIVFIAGIVAAFVIAFVLIVAFRR